MTDTNANLAGLRKELIGVKSEREGVCKGLVEAWKRLGSTEDSLKDGKGYICTCLFVCLFTNKLNCILANCPVFGGTSRFFTLLLS